MRSLAALLALAACATTAAAPTDLEHLRGCWIERRGADTLTIRWPVREQRPGVRIADMLTYHAGLEPEHVRFELRGARGGFEFCPQDSPHGPPCQPAVVGDGQPPADAGTWVRIRATDRSLSIAIEDGESVASIFDGRRDGCD